MLAVVHSLILWKTYGEWWEHSHFMSFLYQFLMGIWWNLWYHWWLLSGSQTSHRFCKEHTWQTGQKSNMAGKSPNSTFQFWTCHRTMFRWVFHAMLPCLMAGGHRILYPIGSMVRLYMVLHGSHQYIPFMLAFFYQHHGSVMGIDRCKNTMGIYREYREYRHNCLLMIRIQQPRPWLSRRDSLGVQGLAFWSPSIWWG